MVYTRGGCEFAGRSTVVHSANQYVRTGGFTHSNTAENFSSIFRRGVIGTYHHMGEAHLARYCAEFDCCYNTRKNLRCGAHCRGRRRFARETRQVSAILFDLCPNFSIRRPHGGKAQTLL